MSNESQFWLNWCVNFVMAIATIAVVLVALFDDWIKACIYSPKLVLSLRNTTGEKTMVTLNEMTNQGPQILRTGVRTTM